MSKMTASDSACSTDHTAQPSPVRVLAFMEATTVTGPAKNLLEFARRARTAPGGVEVSIATFLRGTAQSNAFIEQCREAGIDVQIIRERFLYDPSLVSSVRDVMNRVNPDIVQTHMVKSHFLFGLSGEAKKRRWIAFHHGYTWTTLKTRTYNQLNRFSLRKADRVVSVCGPFATQISESCGVPASRIVVRHNAVKPFFKSDASTIAALRQKLGIPERAIVVVMVGRLSREKAQRDGIEAFGQLLQRRGKSDAHLVVVGDGPEMQSLRSLCSALGISDNVHFVGHEADVAPYLSIADLSVLPSHTEGSPNALLEAMAAGVPTVATSVGGVPEIAEDGRTALLVPSKQPTSICQAMEKLLDDSKLRTAISAAAIERAAKFSEQEYCNAMLELYRECLHGGQAR